MPHLPDVDIDVRNRDEVAALFDFVPASELNPDQTKLVRHKTGVYPQAIPVEQETKLAAFPYTHANYLGYYKIDLIANHVYDQIETPAHLDRIMAMPIDWDWFVDSRFYDPSPIDQPLTHLGNHYDLVRQYPPHSLEEVAILLALVRPGKRDLIGTPMEEIRKTIWQPHADPKVYTFKKPHAFAFAGLVCLHARLICKQL